MGNDRFSVSLLTRLNHQPEFLLMAVGWFFGHMLGYILLGLALDRANAIPRWATWLMIVAVPVMGPLAYGSGQGSLQALGFVLIAVASVPAAVTLLRLRHDQVPPDAIGASMEEMGQVRGRFVRLR